LKDVLVNVLRAPRSEPLSPLIASLLKYIDGRFGSPPTAHYDVFSLLSRLLRGCLPGEGDAEGFRHTDLLDLLARTLHWPRLRELLDLLPALASDPTFKGLIANFRLSNCSSPECSGREGFMALMNSIVGSILRFDNPFPQIRDLLNQLPGGNFSAPPFSTLLSLLENLLVTYRATAADGDVQTPLRRLLRCAQRVDPPPEGTRRPPGHTLYGFVYDLMALEEVSLSKLVTAIDQLLDADPQGVLLRVATSAVDHLRGNPTTFKNLVDILVVVFTEANARKVVPVLIDMAEQRVFDEFADLLLALFGSCDTVRQRQADRT